VVVDSMINGETCKKEKIKTATEPFKTKSKTVSMGVMEAIKYIAAMQVMQSI
tara:strand:+ start:969 stop:1124 length:156 start_codon:yes stop_codon:yes gene_type:complete